MLTLAAATGDRAVLPEPLGDMSRSASLARTLQLKAEQCKVLHVEPSGDCFYECIHKLLPVEGRQPELCSADSMRDYVADSLTDELFQMYTMYAAGACLTLATDA